MLSFIHFAVLGAFILLGAVFSSGKGAGLIAGYNTSPAAKKAGYDERKLCKCMGKLMFALAACWLVVIAGELFKAKAFFWAGFGLFITTLTAGIVYINTSGRLKK